MWLDAIALIILTAFAVLGALRGALATAMGLLSLAVAYGSGLTLGPVLGPSLAGRMDLPTPLGVALAGTGAFLAAYVAMGIVSALVRRLARRHDGERSARDRFLGGVVGAVRGGLIVLLLSWLALWVDALRATGTVESLPELGPSKAAAVTGEIVEKGLGAALADAGPGGRMVARMAARPGLALSELQSVLENPNIERLRSDEMFWTYVENGNVDAALNRLSFERVRRDDELRRRLADLGLIDEGAALDPRAFRNAMADVFGEVGPRIHGLKNDPEVQALMSDPEVVAMLQSGDTLGLLRHAGFRSLVERVTSESNSE
ncbi:MAG TPA: CvpA family protein [Myxococcota bacterium]